MVTVLQPKFKQIKKVFFEQNIDKNIKIKKSPYVLDIYDYGEHIFENILTGEIIACSVPIKETDQEYLIKNWYYIPEDFYIYKIFQDIQDKASESKKNVNNYDLLKNINHAILLTTLGCNANCFYCYEKNDRDQSCHMTKETIDKFINILVKQKKEKIRIGWFGGEPLYNWPIIDYTCEQLKKNNIEYSTSMIIHHKSRYFNSLKLGNYGI